MYTAYFGLTEPPFSIAPDPRFLYMSERHREALAHLLYGISAGGGFVQLTGEVGTGKTTLCRCLLEQVPPEVDVALILNPRLTDVELLATVCDELRVPYPAGTSSRKLLVDGLYQRLLDGHARGRRTVLIIDEAQNLAPEVLEQVRLLTNLETTTQKLLQVILIGQPELIRILEREDLRQLAQRVTARYHLLPFSEAETSAYISHRLEVAGQKQKLFSDEAMREVHRAARGIPRLINAICDRALLGAYAQDRRRIEVATVRRAASEVLGRPVARHAVRPWQWAALALGAVALAALLATLGIGRIGLAPVGAALSRTGPGPRTGSSTPVTSPSDTPRGVGAATTGNGKPTQGVSLAKLLSDPSVRGDKKSAFVSLYGRWGLRVDESAGALGCERGEPLGFRCLSRSGTWAKLRRVDLPAIIELATPPTWDRRYATVAAVDDETATLDFGGRRYTFPLREVDRYWDGPFTVLWKRPALSNLSIGPGMRGRDVLWVRQRLGELDGAPVGNTNRDLFDEELRARVIAFQRSRSLQPDGIVGEETLAHLSISPGDPDVPRLSRGGS
jgi:general secretion pathway protein A